MNSAKIISTEAASGTLKLKELLKRYNMPYEERMEGNVVVIDIKARRGLAQKTTQLFTQPRTGLAG